MEGSLQLDEACAAVDVLVEFQSAVIGGVYVFSEDCESFVVASCRCCLYVLLVTKEAWGIVCSHTAIAYRHIALIFSSIEQLPLKQ